MQSLRTHNLDRSKVGLSVSYSKQNEDHKVRKEIPVEAEWEVN
jgi:hypothetical protein